MGEWQVFVVVALLAAILMALYGIHKLLEEILKELRRKRSAV